MKSATAIANVLKMEGVEYLFCFPSNPLIEAAAAAGIRPILARTERGAVNMADGYTRIAGGGKIGVVATQYGPGIENAYGAVAHAYSTYWEATTPSWVKPWVSTESASKCPVRSSQQSGAPSRPTRLASRQSLR